jgi:hypothetical protein
MRNRRRRQLLQHGENLVQNTIKQAVHSAYENFASPRSTLVAQLLIMALLALFGLSLGQYVDEKASVPMTFDGRP